MKAAESKTTTASQPLQAKAEAQQPFFQAQNEQQGAFFGQETPAAKPFFTPFIQTKLSIGQPGDKYEQEADAMAEQVVQRLASSKTEAPIQRKCAECAAEEEGIAPKLQLKSIFESNEEPAGEQVQRKCAACTAEKIQPMRIQRMGEEEEPELQAKGAVPGLQASADLESRLNSTKGGGSPLSDETRTAMESSFGTDFSGVRVHTNSGAVQMNQELGAQAFTHGSDVYFNSGKYDPGSTEGNKLLGHELTHVVQQGGGQSKRISRMSHKGFFPKLKIGTPYQLQQSPRKVDQEPNLSHEQPEKVADSQNEPANFLTNENNFGTIPDITTPPEEGRRTSQEELSMPEGVGNVVADIQLNFIQPQTNRLSRVKSDAVSSGVSLGLFSQPGGRAVAPFGGEYFEPAFSGISFAFAGGICTIKATLDVICPWGTASGGRTDVPSATDAVVTKANWPDIKADLQPRAASPFKSRRTIYYSQSLVEKHEKFHGTDDNGWVISSGLGIVKTHLEAGTVASASAAADVPVLLNAARTKLISENLKWYKGGGASHDSYAGEIRAYGDGKASYQKLADDVETHGKSLP